MTNEHQPEGRSVRQKPAFFRILRKAIIAVLILYVFAVGFLCFNETTLVYPGQAADVGNWTPPFSIEEIEFKSKDGTRLVGWFLPRNGSKRTILLFHGNAENIASTASNNGKELGEVLNASVFVFDFRGYGKSEGVPSEEAVISDGVAALEWLTQRTNSKPEEIIFYGSSIGGGIAIGVAERQKPRLLLLDRTFDTIVAAAAENYPWVPVHYLMRNRFNSAERIAKIDVPVFISHFKNDELISIARARRLFDAVKSERKFFYEMPGGHHMARVPDEYWPRLADFVDEFDRSFSNADGDTR